jgi:hypothetical protein
MPHPKASGRSALLYTVRLAVTFKVLCTRATLGR